MNRALARCIVDCLRMTGSPQEHLAEIQHFSRRDWDRTVFWLNGSGLAHYFLLRLRELQAEGAVPSEVLGRLAHNFAANQCRLEVMAGEFNDLNHRLSGASLSYVAVKGFDLAPDYCPNLSLRTWYSHEYLLPLGCFGRAQEVLEKAGYRLRAIGVRGEGVFSVQPLRTPAHPDECYTAGFKRLVVLQHRMWNADYSKVNVSPPADVLKRLRIANWQNVSFPVLADEDALILSVLDTFEHILNYWCKLSWLFEIAYLLQGRSADSTFWQRFYDRIEHCGKLPEIAGAVFLLALRFFRLEAPPAVRLRLSDLPCSLRIWVDHYGWEWASAKYPGSKLCLFLHRELIQNQAAWREVRRRRLFPIQRWHGSAEADGSKLPARLDARRSGWSHVLRRAKFHGVTTSQYAWEVPRWKRLLQGDS